MRVQSSGGKESFIFEDQLSPFLEYSCESLRLIGKRPAQFPVISCSISGSTDLHEIIFRHFLQNCEKRLLPRHVYLSVCPPVRMEKHGSHGTDFHEI